MGIYIQKIRNHMCVNERKKLKITIIAKVQLKLLMTNVVFITEHNYMPGLFYVEQTLLKVF